jgi:hypothetical protein
VPSAYSNYLTDEGEALTREAYGPNYDRLVALKKKFDPTNFFPHESQHQARMAVTLRSPLVRVAG